MATTQDAQKERFYAGLLRRLGWHKKELGNPADEQEPPWAGLAEWLRLAHSLLDEKAVELSCNADRSTQVRAIE
jgi:hypothetical protein